MNQQKFSEKDRDIQYAINQIARWTKWKHELNNDYEAIIIIACTECGKLENTDVTNYPDHICYANDCYNGLCTQCYDAKDEDEHRKDPYPVCRYCIKIYEDNEKENKKS